jgi:sugar O-acyltransferase (sialic acid O-acetyltransferase NeuD family)
MKKVVVFGTGDIAQLAHYYFTHDSERQVAGFVVDEEYKKGDTFCDLPLVAMSELARRFPPGEFDAFVAVGYSKMNELRETSYVRLKSLGYEMASYVSSHCTCLSDVIGDNAFILEDNTIQPFVRIGDNVVLWSGNHIGHHSQIGDHSYVTSHVVISGGVTIGRRCFIGVNATLRDHIELGDGTMVGAGAVVTATTEPRSVVRAPKSEVKTFTSDELKKI